MYIKKSRLAVCQSALFDLIQVSFECRKYGINGAYLRKSRGTLEMKNG